MIELSERVSLGYEFDMETKTKKQIRKTIRVKGRTRKEAESLLQREKELLLNNKERIIDRFDDLVKYYYEINNNLKPKSLASDIYRLNIVKEIFSGKLIREITSDFLMQYFQYIEKKYSRTTIHDIYIMLNKFFNFAYEEDIILKNPLSKLRRTMYAKRPFIIPNNGFKYFSIINRFYWLAFNSGDKSFSLKLKTMLLLSADGCLREAELFGLKIDRINLDEGYMEIYENMYRLTEKIANELGIPKVGFTDTKINSSIRKVPLSKITIRYLSAYLKECNDYMEEYNLVNPLGLLFFQRRNIPNRLPNFGKRRKNAPPFCVVPAHNSQYNGAIRKICQRYGLEVFTSHKIRKWAFTLRYNSECTEQYCKYILGHNIGKCDATYILGMYSSAKRQHYRWENILNNIITYGKEDVSHIKATF